MLFRMIRHTLLAAALVAGMAAAYQAYAAGNDVVVAREVE